MYCTLILIVCLFVVVLLAAVALAAALADLRLELVLLVAAQVRVRHVVQRVRVAAGLLVMNITLFQGSQIKLFRKQTARSGFKSTKKACQGSYISEGPLSKSLSPWGPRSPA